MRNLKRVLSFAMASIMLIGMMVVGAGAADLKDADKITHKEAVDVLKSLEIMVGDNNENFNPEAILTREQAAKIVTYMLMGKDAADSLTAAKAPFTDVKADRWSAGSIAYCVKQGILAGMGDGTFRPEANVTGTQFAKMLLTAAGYSAKYEGLTGNGYELNVAKLVKSAGLNDGLKIVLSNDLTRDSAAQMTLNTLTTWTVEYQGGGNVSGDGFDVSLSATRIVNNGKGLSMDEEFVREVYQSSLKEVVTATGAYGRPSHGWKNGVASIGTYPNGVHTTYTASTKESVVKGDLDGYNWDDVSVIVNGKENIAAVASAKNLADLTGNGRLVEIYTKGEAVKTVVIVSSVVGQIANINSVTNTVTINVKSNTGIAPITFKKSTDEAKYNKLVDLGKDAYILLSTDIGDDKVVLGDFNAAESVTGKYTKLATNGQRTIGGVVYDDAYGTDKDNTKAVLGAMEIGSTYNVYLDNYGYALFATKEASASDKSAYILDTDKTGNKVDGYTFKAKLVFEDGTQEWVVVANVNGDKVASDNEPVKGFVTYGVNAEGKYSVDSVKAGTEAIFNDPNHADNKNDAHSYNFTGDIDANKVKFLSSAGYLNNVLGSSKTIFLVAATDGSYKAYTGIKNVPSLDTVTGKVLVAAGTTTASMVILNDGGVSGSKDYIYVTSEDYEANADGDDVVYIYSTVAGDGTVATTSMSKAARDTVIAGGMGLYQITKAGSDKVTALAKVADGTSDATVITLNEANSAADKLIVKDSTVRVIGGSNYVMGDKFTCVAVNKDGSGASPIDAGDFDFYRMADYSKVTHTSIQLDTTGAVSALIFTYELL